MTTKRRLEDVEHRAAHALAEEVRLGPVELSRLSEAEAAEFMALYRKAAVPGRPFDYDTLRRDLEEFALETAAGRASA